MRSHYLIIISLLLFGFGCVFSPLDVSAEALSDEVFILPYDEPVLGENDGILHCYFYDYSTYSYHVISFVYRNDFIDPSYTTYNNIYIDFASPGSFQLVQHGDYKSCISYSTKGQMVHRYDYSTSVPTYTYEFEFSSTNELVGFQVVGDVDLFDINNNDENGLVTDNDFVVLWAEEGEILKELIANNDLTSDQITALSQVVSKLTTTNGLITNTNELLTGCYNYLKALNLDTDTIISLLNQILAYSSDIATDVSDIEYLLELLISMFNKEGSGAVDQQPDTSVQDEYSGMQSELIGDSASSDMDSLDISVNSRGMSFIWNLIDVILNTHSAVFGMFISVLSVGIIVI